MVSLYANNLRERRFQTISRFQPIDDIFEIISWVPIEFLSRAVVNINPPDSRKHFPAPALIFSLIFWDSFQNHHPSVETKI